MAHPEETAIEAGIRNLEERFIRWVRLFETEHRAIVLNVEINRDANNDLHSIKLLVRPQPPDGPDC